jgi:hypothetical protein
LKTQAILQHRSKKGQSAFRSAAHLSKGALGPAVDIRFVARCRWHKGHFRRIEHVCKMETLREEYALAQSNDGAPGSDGVTFTAIEARGVEGFLERIRDELVQHTYMPPRGW